MPMGPHFRKTVLAAKQRLADGTADVRRLHERGLPGIQVGNRLSSLLDSVVSDLFESVLEDLDQADAGGLREKVALVPHGGYGRRVLAPYSDVDLMILHDPSVAGDVAQFAKRLTQDIYDTGLDLGHSVRTVADACRLARNDPIIFTSLVESRYLAGSDPLFRDFQERFSKAAQRRSAALLTSLIDSRRAEQHKYGETVYLLEPNIKRSRGGLRDIQLIRWIGFAKYGVADPDHLQRIGALSHHDQRRLRAAHEFLARTRNEMHFYSRKASDVLDRPEQLRMAEFFGFRGTAALLPVEQFMREYFRHTSNVRYMASRFAEHVRPAPAVKRILGPVFSQALGNEYRIGLKQIGATARGMARLKTDLAEVLRLMDFASQFDRRIDHGTWAAVYRASPNYPRTVSDQAIERFRTLLGRPARLGELLRRLHELGVLERLVPAFAHARCLLQFNEYHKYTVDEHCIRAVECATELEVQDHLPGRVYRQIQDKTVLHLALLVHDLGKGQVEDHSEVGRRIAVETADRLRLEPREREILEFLVHKHLMMSHLAFRRDTSDESLVLRFAVDVGSPEVLSMLLVLTCADLASVGPGVLNGWKIEVLGNLYRRAMRHLSSEAGVDTDVELEARRKGVLQALGTDADDAWFVREVESITTGCLWDVPAETLADGLKRAKRLVSGTAEVWARFLPGSQTIEFLAAVHSSLSEGLFARLTGAISAQGLRILSADINTLAGGLILDRFVVEDEQYEGSPPQQRLDAVCQSVVGVIRGERPPKFGQLWGSDRRRTKTELTPMPTEVHIDNNTSHAFTIVDVFTFDRRGLLYSIAESLRSLELSIGVARIGTYLDQVVDVFYVTDASGQKIRDPDRLDRIRQTLLEAVDAPQGEEVDSTRA